MKILKLILFGAAGVLLSYGAFLGSMDIIENINAQYEPENPLSSGLPNKKMDAPTDIDKTISHTVEGAGEAESPVDAEQNYTVYEDKLYVTDNEGRSWMQVPDDTGLGYARISGYLDAISASSIYISSEKIAIAYGGRGSENISIIKTDSRGEVWSVGSVSQTATHDLENGYEKMYIDFLEDGRTGYFAAVTAGQEVLAFRSVNSGVTWDPVTKGDPLFNEIMEYFKVQGTFYEEE